MKLTQLDLRNEVLDHMANGIEEGMDKKDIGFKNAFDQEKKRWNPELTAYSSWWLGWAWVGPKIMMRKCVKKMKQFYLVILLSTTAIMALLHLIYKAFDVMEFRDGLNRILGMVYLVCLGLILFFIKIKASKYHSSYGFLFKINSIGFTFMYVLYNLLWNDAMMIYGKEATYGGVLFFHAFLLSFTYTFWDLYKSHFNTKKRNLV